MNRVHRRASRMVRATIARIRFDGFVAFAILAGCYFSPLHAAPVDLSQYTLVGRYDLPDPTRVTPPPNSLLAQEASAVTWNRDTNSLFVVGDGATSVVQVSLTGQLLDSMTLTGYYDTEGLTYVGSNQFVVVEEPYRIASLFTYAPGTTLAYAGALHVKLGTTIVGNNGLEGISYDPLTGGFILAKEREPRGIFQTTMDFDAGTASNGSPTTVNSVNLFDPALASLGDFSDVFALSSLLGVDPAQEDQLLILSQLSGRVIQVDRSGNIVATLNIPLLPDSGGLSVTQQGHEGLTMDDARILYLVSERGGGTNNPQLWVFAPPVPEPASCVLAGLACAGLLGCVRRSKRRSRPLPGPTHL